MAQQIFVKLENGITGPHTPKKIREMANNGTLLPHDLISFDQESWGSASGLKGLSFPELSKQETGTDLAKSATQLGKSFLGKLQGAAEVVSVTVSKIQSEREVSKKQLIEVHNQRRSGIQRFLSEEQDPKIIESTVPRIEQFLTSEEALLYIAVQKKPVANIAPDCIALTSRRMIFFTVKLLGQLSFNDHLWRNVVNATVKEGILGATFSATVTNGMRISIDYLPKAQARMLYRFAQEMEEKAFEERRTRMMEENRSKVGGVVVQNNVIPNGLQQQSQVNDDPMAVLQKLKSMLEAGLITPEEFAAKKADVLKRL